MIFERFIVEGQDGLSVEWDWIGEGICGHYNKSDRTDEPRLRASLLHNGHVLDDGSYCTRATDKTPKEELIRSAKELMSVVIVTESRPDGGRFNTRVMEMWSWRSYSK